MYISSVTLKITEPNKSVLESTSALSRTEIQDRFIANEIKVITKL
jgi:hypothetical protein